MGEATRPVRLLICDDHKLLTDALTIAVRADPGIELAAPAFNDPEAVVAAVAELRPDVVLMDVSFDGSAMNGIDATRRIKKDFPETSVVIVTGQEEDRFLVAAVEAGASGFLRKNEAIAGVIDAARAAARGEILIDPQVLMRLLPQAARARSEETDARRRLEGLTPREIEILQALARGGRNEDVATMMHVSPQTVQSHIHHILGKLNVHSKLEAVVFATKYGAIEV